MCRRWVAKNNPRDYGSEETYWGPSKNGQPAFSGSPLRIPVVSRFGKRHLNSHLSWPLSSTGLLPYKNTELAQAAVIQLDRVVQSWVKVTQG